MACRHVVHRVVCYPCQLSQIETRLLWFPEAAQKAREAVDAKAVQAEAAARSEVEGARSALLAAERKVADASQLLDSLRQELLAERVGFEPTVRC